MSIEFNQGRGQADIIRNITMEESNEVPGSGRPAKRQRAESSIPSASRQRAERLLGVRENLGQPSHLRPETFSLGETTKPEHGSGYRDQEGSSEVLYSDEVRKVRVFRPEGGPVVITGSGEKNPDLFSASKINALLKQVDIDEQIDFPENWESLPISERNAWLKDKDVLLMPAIEGGAMEPVTPRQRRRRMTREQMRREQMQLRRTQRGRGGNGGIGAEVPRRELSELMTLINARTRLYDERATNPRWQELEGEILAQVNNGDYGQLHKAQRDLETLLSMARAPILKEKIDAVIPQQLRLELEQNIQGIDDRFKRAAKEMPEDGYEALIKDLKEEGRRLFRSFKWGSSSLDEAERRLLMIAGSWDGPEAIRGTSLEGYRRWFAYQEYKKLEMADEIHSRTEVQESSEENIKAMELAKRFFERSGSIDVFRAAIGRLDELMRAIEESDDVDPEQKRKLERSYIGWKDFTPVLLLMEETMGNPGQISEAAAKLDKQSIHDYFDRDTNLTDRDGKAFLVDAQGRKIFTDQLNRVYFLVGENTETDFNVPQTYSYRDSLGAEQQLELVGNNYVRRERGKVERITLNQLNLRSVAINVFDETYEEDRIRDNIVQELTKRELKLRPSAADIRKNIENGGVDVREDERWIIRRALGVDDQTSDMYTPNFDFASMDVTLRGRVNAKLREINEWWGRDKGKTNKLVEQWRALKTYVGVKGFYGSDYTETDLATFGKNRKAMREDEIMRVAVPERLRRLGVSDERMNTLYGLKPDRIRDEELPDNFDLLESTKWSASNFSRYTHADSLDRLRVYNRDGEHVDTIFGKDTPYLARQVTHPMDFWLNEGHGDIDSNKIIVDEFNKDTRSFMNANLERLVKTVKLAKEYLPEDVQREIDREVDAEVAAKNLNSKTEAEDYVIADMLYKGRIKTSNINWIQASQEFTVDEVGDFEKDRADAEENLKKVKDYSLQPFLDELESMFETHWSRRHVRRHRQAKVWVRIHKKIGETLWQDKFQREDGISNSEMSDTISFFQAHNYIDPKSAEEERIELLGNTMQRFWRQAGEFSGKGARLMFDVRKHPGWAIGKFWDFIKSYFTAWFKYTASFGR